MTRPTDEQIERAIREYAAYLIDRIDTALSSTGTPATAATTLGASMDLRSEERFDALVTLLAGASLSNEERSEAAGLVSAIRQAHAALYADREGFHRAILSARVPAPSPGTPATADDADRPCPVGCGPCHEDPGPWHDRGCPRWRATPPPAPARENTGATPDRVRDGVEAAARVLAANGIDTRALLDLRPNAEREVGEILGARENTGAPDAAEGIAAEFEAKVKAAAEPIFATARAESYAKGRRDERDAILAEFRCELGSYVCDDGRIAPCESCAAARRIRSLSGSPTVAAPTPGIGDQDKEDGRG